MRKLILMVLLGLILAAPAFAVDGVMSSPIADSNYSNSDKAIYRNYIVLADGGPVLLYDIDKGTSETIGQGYFPDIYGNTIVWHDSIINKVVKYDIKTKITTPLSEECGYYYEAKWRARIHGTKIVWIRGSDGLIQVHDLLTGQTSSLPVSGFYLAIYDDKLAYVRDCNIYSYDPNNGETFIGTPRDCYWNYPMIDANYIYWVGQGVNRPTAIHRYNLATYLYDSFDICQSSPMSPMVSDGKVYIDGSSSGTNCPNRSYIIGQLDPKTGTTSIISSPIDTYQFYPAVYDGRIVLSYGDAAGEDVRLFDITAPSEEVYSLNASGNTVTVINPYDKRIVTTIQTSITANAGPSDAALSPGESYYYVFNSSEKSVAIIKTIDSTDYTVLSTVLLNPLASQSITGITGDDNGNAYVTVKRTGQPGEVWKVNQSGRTLLQALTGNYPSGIKISKEKDSQGNDLYKLFVSDSQSGNVTVVNLTDSSNSGITTNAGSKIVRP